MTVQKITPYLWFDDQAQEAARFYCSLFEDAQILSDRGMLVEFELAGMRFIALNGGPQFQFNEAVSFYVRCADQAEVDRLWDRLTAEGGREGQCSWCQDKYGLSWQIVPSRFVEMMETGSPAQQQRVMAAMLKMKKMVVAEFEQAFAGA